MGCGASNSTKVTSIVSANPEFVDLSQIQVAWDKAWQTVEVKKRKGKDANLVIKRRGWKTVRVFVSSTFKDFHSERELLVKKVFPDLRLWCEARRLYLVECDLRWGVPKDFTTEGTLRACLGEIDRCYQDNIMPFFLNMTSERVGWIPTQEEVPESIQNEYQWIEGLSVTEMEILHGAYRIDNPNALFMIRDSTFLEQVPEEYRNIFVDNQTIAPSKLAVLKKKIKERFQKDIVHFYNVKWLGYDSEKKMPELEGLEETFRDQVFEFFKRRIAAQYPLDEGKLDPYQVIKESHESFMRSRADRVIGREDITNKVVDYICGVGNDVPFVLLGGPGSGKSSLVAKLADIACNKSNQGRIPGGGGQQWHVFYHFVGAVPGSTELLLMLRRLLKEIGIHKDDASLPSDLDTAAQQTASALSNAKTRPTVIVVDALNQFDEDDAAMRVAWVPPKLAPHIRCVFSMIQDTPQHVNLQGREPTPQMTELAPLSRRDREAIVDELLGQYNKRLDPQQLDSLLSKKSSENPLWLSIACEELRVFGQFRQLSDKINSLADGLLELEVQVIDRFERENGGGLLVATLCLLEVSARGLLETELLSILGDEDNLHPSEKSKDASEKEDEGREKSAKDIGMLPAYKWSEVYRALRPFLRPFGDSGEGRLDFYHRSLSKAVRRKYLKDSNGKPLTEVYQWWHRKLADYFEVNCVNLSRQIEELPVHLIAIKDRERLEKFLTRWDIFNELYDFNYSMKLLAFWRKGSTYDNMGQAYSVSVKNFVNQPKVTTDEKCRKYEQIGQLCAQSGQWTFAKEFSKLALEIEQDELGARADRMADLYYLQAKVKDEEMKLVEYMYRSQLPTLWDIIALFESSVKFRKDLIGKDHQEKLGRTLNRLAFYYSSYAIRGGDEHMDAETAKEKAMTAVDSAISIFKELKDEENEADSYTTKGVVYGRSCPEQLKAYTYALELGIKAVGEVNMIMDRLLLNYAIYWEEVGDYNRAYENFYKWYEVSHALYGPQHPKAARPVNTLREPMYKRIAAEKGKPVPKVYTGQEEPEDPNPISPEPTNNAEE